MGGVEARQARGTTRRAGVRTVGIALAIAALLATTAAGPAAATTSRGADGVDWPLTGAAAERVKAIALFDAKPGRAARGVVERAGGKVRHTLALVNGLAIELPRGRLKALAAAPGVRRVELDARLKVEDHGPDTGDHEYENAWGVEHIGSRAAHAAGIRGQGVKVAVIDTGIDYIHDDPDDNPYVVDPEFTSNYLGGYDFFNNDADPMDDYGHGTHVAGSLAAEKNGYLVVGVAPAVDLYALKVLGAAGEGQVSDLIRALQWSLDNNIDVVNMSLGTHEVSTALQTAVENAADQGLLMIAASGNTVTFDELLYGCPVAYPGAYPDVLSTTFTNENDALTGYSCTGPEVDFAAPGDNVFSPVPVGSCAMCSPYGYAAASGTSMASPHLAGTVALLLSAGLTDQGQPGMFDDVRARLCATANQGWGVQTGFGGGTPIPPNDPRYAEYFGCGVVDADEAVLGLTPPPPPTNRAPVANGDSATTNEDTAVSISVTVNDSDPDGDPLTITAVGSPTSGTAVLEPGGTTIRFTPAPNASGSASFDYTIADGRGGTATAAVTVTINPVNDAPVAVNDAATTVQDAAVTIAVLGNDTDIDGPSLSVGSTSTPAHGSVVVNPDGTITYTPAAGYSGSDAFGYSATDGAAASNVATVSITITAAPPPPPPTPSLHVGDLDRASSNAGKSWTARVTIRIDDGAHAALSGAVVSGSWSNGANGSASCTTATNGTCTVQKTKLSRSGVASVTFTVTGVSRSGWTYAPSLNHDPDGESTGTSIVVLRPV